MSASGAAAQVAMIKDQDGYTNVRALPDGQAPVIYQISATEVFWYGDTVANTTWVKVYIPKNRFSFGSTHPDYLEGYLHGSRLQRLEKLPVYRGREFSFAYVMEPFFLKNRIVDKHNGKAVVAIGGRPVWGTDGNFPRTQVKAVQVSFSGQQIPVHPAFYEDIYECTNDFKIYRIGATYLVHQWNSDGAGGYEIVWVFTRDGLKQRLVGSMV